MIKNIFFPEKIGSRRVLSQRILSFYIHEHVLYAAVVLAKSHGYVIEELIEQPFIQQPSETKQDYLTDLHHALPALQSIMHTISKIDQISIAIPAHLTIIKELELPFTDEDKIRLVLGYEIEPMLPFPLEDAVVDFIITQSDSHQNVSKIIAVAIRKIDLEHILSAYKQASIDPSRITLDLISMYNLFLQIPAYAQSDTTCASVDIGLLGTRVTFFHDKQLKLTRHIPKGIAHLISNISIESGVERNVITEILLAEGTEAITKQEYGKIIQKYLVNFLNEIQFTLDSFSLKLNYKEGVTRILFSGKANDIPHLMSYSSELLQLPCELFNPQQIFDQPAIQKNKTIASTTHWNNFIAVLGAAMNSPKAADFTLRRQEFTFIDERSVMQQFVTAFILFFILIATISTRGYVQLQELKKTSSLLEQSQERKLRALLPPESKRKKMNLSNLSKAVEQLLKEKNDLWAPFMQKRISPLEMMLELTKIIDKKQFNVTIEEFNLTEESPGIPLIELQGYFKSEKGLGFHHTEWAEVENRMRESSLLTLADIPSSIPAAEKGIKFSLKLKKNTNGKDDGSEEK